MSAHKQVTRPTTIRPIYQTRYDEPIPNLSSYSDYGLSLDHLEANCTYRRIGTLVFLHILIKRKYCYTSITTRSLIFVYINSFYVPLY
jgi:hypothetical protein